MAHMKRIALAVAMGAVALIVLVPAAASAEVGAPGHWNVNEERLEEGVEETVTFEGHLGIAYFLGGAECNMRGTVEIWDDEAGTTTADGQLTEFEIETAPQECETTGLLGACEVASAGVKNLNWPTEASFIGGAGSVEINNVTFTNTFKSGCIISNLEVGGLGQDLNGTLESDSEGCINAITFNDAGPLTTSPNIGTVSLSGSLGVETGGGNCVTLEEGE